MNWLGELVQKEITSEHTVLDLGCGVMQATDELKAKIIIAVDIWDVYLDQLKHKYPTIKADLRKLDCFLDDTYDVVICLDVLEHLEEDEAIKLIEKMKKICRFKVIIYTPNIFKTNDDATVNAWGWGRNEHQKHRCLLDNTKLKGLGFSLRNDNECGGNYGLWLKR